MSEQRIQARKNVTWKVAVIVPGTNQALPARTQDISITGGSIFSPAPLHPGQEYRLIFAVPDSQRTKHNYVETSAQVVYSTLVGQLNEYRVGMQFKMMSAQHKALLEKELGNIK